MLKLIIASTMILSFTLGTAQASGTTALRDIVENFRYTSEVEGDHERALTTLRKL